MVYTKLQITCCHTQELHETNLNLNFIFVYELKSNALAIYMYILTEEINKHSSNIFGKIIIEMTLNIFLS